jgi:hypothetical protein
MHTIGAADTRYDITIDGRPATLDDVMPNFGDDDRLGIVVRGPLSGLGASALVLAMVTEFYAQHAGAVSALAPGELLYPQHYVFHVGRARGEYSWLDFWPPDKESVVADGPATLAQALVDRRITRLLIEDARPAPTRMTLPGEAAHALDRQIVTALAYSRTGRTTDADVTVTSNESAETWVQWTIDPQRGADESGRPNAAKVVQSPSTLAVTDAERAVARQTRAALLHDGRPVETYRRLDRDQVLDLL